MSFWQNNGEYAQTPSDRYREYTSRHEKTYCSTTVQIDNSIQDLRGRMYESKRSHE